MKKLLANIVLAEICLFGHSQIAPPVEPVRITAPLSSNIWVQPEMDAAARTARLFTGNVDFINPSTTAELLDETGEVFIQKNYPGGAISLMRGFGTNRQVLLVDGFRMTNAIAKNGDQQDMILLDPYSFSHSEVIPGPGPVKHGSDAIGGVIGFKSRQLKYASTDKGYLNGNAVFRFSSANMGFSGHLELSAGWEKWALVTSISRSWFDDVVMGRNGPEEYLRPDYAERLGNTDVITQNDDPLVQVPSGFTLMNLIQKVSFKPTDNWEMTYGFYYANTSKSPRYDRLLMPAEDLPIYAESFNGPRNWIMNSLAINYRAPSLLCDGMDIRLAYQYFGDSRTDRLFNDDLRSYRDDMGNSFNLNIEMFKYFLKGHRITYGMEIMIDNLRSESSGENILTGETFLRPGSYPKTEWSSYGLYIDYAYKINDKTDVNAGIRYNLYLMEASFDTSFISIAYPVAFFNNDAMTGNLCLAYRPADKWLLNIGLSTAFRPPRVDEIGMTSSTEMGTVLSPNTSLKSEYAYNAEASVSRIFGNFLKVDLTGYYTFLNRAMTHGEIQYGGKDSLTTKDIAGPVEATQNSAHAMAYGLQAALQARLPMGFSISSSFNYQAGFEALPNNVHNPLRHAAPFFGMARLTYTASKYKVELYTHYSGRIRYENLSPEELERGYLYARDENGNPFSPGWCTLNLRGAFQVTRFLSVGGGFENITNARYRPYGSALAAPGRGIIISVKGEF